MALKTQGTRTGAQLFARWWVGPQKPDYATHRDECAISFLAGLEAAARLMADHLTQDGGLRDEHARRN